MIDEQGVRQQLSVTKMERDLGVLVKNDLTLGAQCKAAAAAANWKFGVLKKASPHGLKHLGQNSGYHISVSILSIRYRLGRLIFSGILTALSASSEESVSIFQGYQISCTSKGSIYGWTTLLERRRREDAILIY